MLVQIIGLPGTGKSYAIKKYLSTTIVPIRYYDHASPDFRESGLSTYRTILESACGYALSQPNIIIKLQVKTSVRHEQLRKRGELPDYFEEARLSHLMLNPNFRIHPSQLGELLGRIYGTKTIVRDGR